MKRKNREVTIRLAQPSDLETIAMLLQKLEKEDGSPWGQAPRLPCYFLKEAAIRLGDSLGRVWIAFETITDADGTTSEAAPVGQIFTRIEDYREGFAGGFFVEKRAPYNTAYFLLRAAAHWFTLKECEIVHISTGPKNHTRRAYERMGFVPTQQIQTAPINSIRVGLHLSPIELPPPLMPLFAK